MSTIKLESKLNISNLKKKVAEFKKVLILKVGFIDPEMAKIAMKNEYGGVYPVSPEYKARAQAAGVDLGDTITIIPRPFMQTTIDSQQNKWQNVIENLFKKNEASKAIAMLGEVIKADIQYTISNNDFERNPAHIAKIKGRDRPFPLVDTGKMRNSVQYEIK